MTTKDKPVTNGEFVRDGQRYKWCGNTAVPIRKFDKDGKEIDVQRAQAVLEAAEEA